MSFTLSGGITWLILAIIIIITLFILWLFPKAIKGWNVAWGKGFTRIYYVLAFIVTLVLAGTESDFKFAEFMFKYMKKQ